MKILSWIVLIMTFFASCETHSSNNNNETVESNSKKEKAKDYYKRAQKFAFKPATDKDSIPYAITLLDSAIVLDSEDPEAYLLKQSYQIKLGEYENALKTIEKLEKIIPNNPDLKSTKGFCYLLNGNSQSAKIALMESDSLWSIRLDTISPNNDWALLGALLGKAANLKLLGDEDKSNNVYKRILKDSQFDKLEYKGLKKDIDSLFLNQSKEEFFSYLVQGLKGDKSPNR